MKVSEIAVGLHLSEPTVYQCLRSICNKLGLDSTERISAHRNMALNVLRQQDDEWSRQLLQQLGGGVALEVRLGIKHIKIMYCIICF